MTNRRRKCDEGVCTPPIYIFYSSLPLNVAEIATARDWCQSSTDSMNGERLLSCRRSVAPGGMPGGGAFGGGDIQWRTYEWGDPARDALTWLSLPSNSDSRTASDAFKIPTLGLWFPLWRAAWTPLGTSQNPFGIDRSDFAGEIDVGGFLMEFSIAHLQL